MPEVDVTGGLEILRQIDEGHRDKNKALNTWVQRQPGSHLIVRQELSRRWMEESNGRMPNNWRLSWGEMIEAQALHAVPLEARQAATGRGRRLELVEHPADGLGGDAQDAVLRSRADQPRRPRTRLPGEEDVRRTLAEENIDRQASGILGIIRERDAAASSAEAKEHNEEELDEEGDAQDGEDGDERTGGQDNDDDEGPDDPALQTFRLAALVGLGQTPPREVLIGAALSDISLMQGLRVVTHGLALAQPHTFTPAVVAWMDDMFRVLDRDDLTSEGFLDEAERMAQEHLGPDMAESGMKWIRAFRGLADEIKAQEEHESELRALEAGPEAPAFGPILGELGAAAEGATAAGDGSTSSSDRGALPGAAAGAGSGGGAASRRGRGRRAPADATAVDAGAAAAGEGSVVGDSESEE